MSFLILFASVMIVLAVGLLLGFIISLASHFLSVPKEERIEQIEELLPGANCGACGFAGCAAYAEAIVLNGAPLTQCTSLNADGLQKIGEIMGQKVEAQAEPEKAFIACHAAPFDKEATQFLYSFTAVWLTATAVLFFTKVRKSANTAALEAAVVLKFVPSTLFIAINEIGLSSIGKSVFPVGSVSTCVR